MSQTFFRGIFRGVFPQNFPEKIPKDMAIDTAPGRLSRNNEEPISIAVFAKIQASFRAYGEIFKRHPAAPLGHLHYRTENGHKIRILDGSHTGKPLQASPVTAALPGLKGRQAAIFELPRGLKAMANAPWPAPRRPSPTATRPPPGLSP